jgi:transposase-like protein
MNCPHCQASQTRKLNETTDLGYAVFRCGQCGRKFNQRTGSPFNYLEFPTDIVFQVVLCRLRYKLSLRDLAEMFLLRGFEFSYEAVRNGKSTLHRCLPSTCVTADRAKSGRFEDIAADPEMVEGWDIGGREWSAAEVGTPQGR